MPVFMTMGKYEVELLSSPTSFNRRSAANYSEYPYIGRKAGLQLTGFAPDDIAITIRLHSMFADPAAVSRQLESMKNNGEVFSLVFASGDYLGTFVLKDVDTSLKQTDGSGSLMFIDVNISLKENVGDPSQPNPPGVFGSGLRISASSNPSIPVVPAPGNFFTSIQTAISVAAKVGETVSRVNEIVGRAAQGDLIGAVGLAGAHAPQLISIAQELPVDAFADLEQVQAIAVDSGKVAQQMAFARDGLMQGATLFQGASTLSAISSASLPVQGALSAMQSAGPSLSRLEAHTRVGSRITGVFND